MQNPQKIFMITEHRLPPATDKSRGWGRTDRECHAWCRFFADDYEWIDWPGRASFWRKKQAEYQATYERNEQIGIRGHISDPAIENELEDRGLEEKVQQCYMYQYKKQRNVNKENECSKN